MASSVSLLAAMITEEAAAAYLARRKRSRFPTWCESVSPHCSYLRVSGVCGRRTVPTFVSPCTIMVSPLPGRRVLLCASPGIRSWSLCCRSVLNRRSPATNRSRAIPRSVSATVPDRPGSFRHVPFLHVRVLKGGAPRKSISRSASATVPDRPGSFPLCRGGYAHCSVLVIVLACSVLKGGAPRIISEVSARYRTRSSRFFPAVLLGACTPAVRSWSLCCCVPFGREAPRETV